MSVARLTFRSGVWNLAANVGQQALNFLFFVYTARLLDPTAFGLMALAMVLVDSFTVVGRFGLVEATIQRADMPDALQNRVFWLLQAVGLAATFALWFGAGPLADAFSHPEMAQPLRWLAPVCWLLNSSAVPEARLQRAFGHGAMARSTLWGVTAGGAVGVAFAVAGFGVFSLVAQKFVSVAVQCVLMWSKERWRPSLPTLAPTTEIRQLVGIGFHVTSANLVLMLNTKLMDLLVGLFMGAATLGYLRTAWRCFEFVLHVCVGPLANVSLVTFSRVRSEPARLFVAYGRMLEIASLAIFPIFFGLAATAPLAMPLVFGDQWAPAAPLMQALSLIAVAGAPNPFFVPMMTATGNTSRLTTQGVIHIVLSLLLTAAMTPFGVMAVAIAQVARATLMTGVSLWMMRFSVDLPYAATWAAIRPGLISAGFMSIVVWSSLYWHIFAPLTGWLLLSTAVVAGVAAYGLGLVLGFRQELGELWNEARALLRRDEPLDAATPV